MVAAEVFILSLPDVTCYRELSAAQEEEALVLWKLAKEAGFSASRDEVRQQLADGTLSGVFQYAIVCTCVDRCQLRLQLLPGMHTSTRLRHGTAGCHDI